MSVHGDGDDEPPAAPRGLASSRRFWRTVWLIAGAGLIARITYVTVMAKHAPLGLDATWYSFQAGTIDGGAGYVDPHTYFTTGKAVATANFPPAWPILLAAVHHAGIETERAFRIVGALVGTTTIVSTAAIGRRLLGSRVGVVAAALVACSPYLIATDGSLMSESLYLAFVAGAVLATIVASEHGRLREWCLAGLLFGFASLTRTDGVIVAVVVIGVAAVRSRVTGRRMLLTAGCAIATCLAVLVPWTVRNSVRLGGIVVLSSNSGSAIAGANCARTYAGPFLGAWDVRCEHLVGGREELRSAAEDRRRGLDYAVHHAGRLVSVVVPVRVLRGWGLWDPRAQVDLEAVESRNAKFQYVGWVMELGLLSTAVAGFVIARRRREVGVLVALVGAATIVLVVSWGNQRLRLVAEPALAVFAAQAVVTWTSRRPGVRVTPKMASSPS
ncbi:MAG: glycosyltransferase family 39 protein [Acidimicrobiia bacterium]